MTRRRFAGALAVLLLVAGCGRVGPPVRAPRARAGGDAAAAAARGAAPATGSAETGGPEEEEEEKR